MINNILFAYDDTEVSHKALAYVKTFALKFGAKVKLVHIYSSPSFIPNLDFGQITPVFSNDMEQTFRKRGEQTLLDVQKEFKDMDVEISTELVRSESIGSTIIEICKNESFDLLVLGRHLKTGFESFFMGSTTEHITHEVKCPVLIISEKPNS